jgi:type IV secretory pathway TrbF-like protein
MTQTKQKQIINAIDGLSNQLELIRSLVNDTLLQNKEWLNSKEFALLANINSKSVSNYVGKGKYEKTKRDCKGKHLIHISELKRHLNE